MAEKLIRDKFKSRPESALEVVQEAKSKYNVDISTSLVYKTLKSMDISFKVTSKCAKASDPEFCRLRSEFVLDFAHISKQAKDNGIELIYIDECSFNYGKSMSKNRGWAPKGMEAFAKNLDKMNGPSVYLLFALSSSGFRYAELVSDSTSGKSSRYIIPNEDIEDLKYYLEGEENDLEDEDFNYNDNDVVQLNSPPPSQSSPAYSTRSRTRYSSLPKATPYLEMVNEQPVKRKRGRPPGSRNQPKDGVKKPRKTTNSQRFTTFIENMLKEFKKDALLVYDNAPSHKDEEVMKVIKKLKRTSTKICRLPPYTPMLNAAEYAFGAFKRRLAVQLRLLRSPTQEEYNGMVIDTVVNTDLSFRDLFLKLDYYTYAIQLSKGDVVGASCLLYDLRAGMNNFNND